MRKALISSLTLCLVSTFSAPLIAQTAPTARKDQWPQCAHQQFKIEDWEIITPDDIAADRAVRAVQWLEENKSRKLDPSSEVIMVLNSNLIILEGYTLMMQSKYGIKNANEKLCSWLSTHTFPE